MPPYSTWHVGVPEEIDLYVAMEGAATVVNAPSMAEAARRRVEMLLDNEPLCSREPETWHILVEQRDRLESAMELVTLVSELKVRGVDTRPFRRSASDTRKVECMPKVIENLGFSHRGPGPLTAAYLSPGVHRHYSGDLYTAVCIGHHHESRELMVGYVSLKRGGFNFREFATPGKDSWLDRVRLDDGRVVDRFEWLAEQPT